MRLDMSDDQRTGLQKVSLNYPPSEQPGGDTPGQGRNLAYVILIGLATIDLWIQDPWTTST